MKSILTDRLDWMDNNLTGVDCYTGLNRSFTENFELFPNPAHNQVFVKTLQNNGNLRVMLFDVNGRMLHSGYYDASGLIKIDISSCKPGLYVIEVIDGGKIIFRKLVIE
jgi:hypothetical protein